MRRYVGIKSLAFAVALAAVAAGVAAVSVQPASGTPSASPAVKGGSGTVAALVAAMTLDEKLGMVNGWPNGVSAPPQTDRVIGVGFIPGVPRLGVPALTFTDGPAGVRMNLPTTAMPAPVALAATFSADLAERYGEVLGRDGRSRDSAAPALAGEPGRRERAHRGEDRAGGLAPAQEHIAQSAPDE